MKVFTLTPALYEKLLSRGMYLVCRRCGLHLTPTMYRDATGKVRKPEIISKPSKYRQWICQHCRHKYGANRPANIYKCVFCGTEGPMRTTATGKIKQEPIIKDIGRKFYCIECFNSTVYDLIGIWRTTDEELV